MKPVLPIIAVSCLSGLLIVQHIAFVNVSSELSKTRSSYIADTSNLQRLVEKNLENYNSMHSAYKTMRDAYNTMRDAYNTMHEQYQKCTALFDTKKKLDKAQAPDMLLNNPTTFVNNDQGMLFSLTSDGSIYIDWNTAELWSKADYNILGSNNMYVAIAKVMIAIRDSTWKPAKG